LLPDMVVLTVMPAVSLSGWQSDGCVIPSSHHSLDG